MPTFTYLMNDDDGATVIETVRDFEVTIRLDGDGAFSVTVRDDETSSSAEGAGPADFDGALVAALDLADEIIDAILAEREIENDVDAPDDRFELGDAVAA